MDPNEMMVCPYDSAHRVSRQRMQYHIVKCQKNHETANFKVCPFNAQHIVPNSKFSYHLKICPDQVRMQLEVYHDTHQYKQKGNTSLPSYEWTPPVQSTDDWD